MIASEVEVEVEVEVAASRAVVPEPRRAPTRPLGSECLHSEERVAVHVVWLHSTRLDESKFGQHAA
ncbi:hypothetical protein QFZ61_000496 [Arthrobacter sp. B3I4]|nr:hypothetical protein [Arthrobacter sp. B3I4]